MKQVSHCDDSVDNFYTSWSDLVSLLLVFFIYLFSISEINVVKFFEAKQSIKGEVAVNYEVQEDVLANIKKTQEQLSAMQNSLMTYIVEHDLQQVLTVENFPDRLELNLGNTLLFGTGSADLKVSAKRVLTKIGELFMSTQGRIVVEGHTDDLPIRTEQFPSNWELSSSRAASVVRFMSGTGIDEARFIVMGFNQYSSIAPNSSEENRSKNRRVKIVLKPDVLFEKGGKS